MNLKKGAHSAKGAGVNPQILTSSLKFSHRELSLALFALEGGELPAEIRDPCSPDEHACPVVESLAEFFDGPSLPPEKKLARHLVKHLQQGWIECGLMDMDPSGLAQSGARSSPPGRDSAESDVTLPGPASAEQMLSARRMADSLRKWSCEIELAREERQLLSKALAGLPGSAWITMPRTMWRLRRKLKY